MAILEPALVVKYGGSSLDLELDVSKQELKPMTKVGPALRSLGDITPVVVMPGGGPTNDLLKAVKRNYEDDIPVKSGRTMVQLLKDVLAVNSLLLAMVWGDETIVESVVEPEPPDPEWLQRLRNRLLTRGLHILPYAPEQLVAQNDLLSYKNSDTLTLAVANWLGARTVLFLKDADGIFEYDQKWPLPEFKNRRYFFGVGYHAGVESPKDPSMPSPEKLVGTPEFRASLTARAMLDTVWRVSPVDGQRDHLIEDDAINYLASRPSEATVERVVIGQVLEVEAIVQDLAREVMSPSIERRYSLLRP